MEGKNIYCCEKEELHEDAIKEVEKELPEDQLLLDLAELYKLFSDFSRRASFALINPSSVLYPSILLFCMLRLYQLSLK